MVQKISRPSPFIISVNYGINIAWEERQTELRGKMGRNPGAMGIGHAKRSGPCLSIIRRAHDAFVETA